MYPIPAWQVALLLLLALSLVIEGGYRLGKRRHHLGHEGVSGSFSSIMGAVLGVLGLLLAFSFSMAVERYDLRKKLVLQEANAIGTSHLRASLLVDPARSQMKGLLAAYTDARLDRYRSGADTPRADRAAAESRRLQDEIWTLAATEASRDPHAVSVALLVESINEMIDLSAERTAARQNHVPELVLFMLFLAVLLAGVLVGYAFGKADDRNLLASTVFAMLVMLVVFVILDLDRPQRGLIRVNEQVMQDLRASFQN